MDASTSRGGLQTSTTALDALASATDGQTSEFNAHLLSAREFLVDSYQVFAGLQQLAAAGHLNEGELPTVETCQHYARIAALYRAKLHEHLTQVDDEEGHRHWRSVYAVWHLAEILYFPEDGQGSFPVGEELLHWLNTIDAQPSRADGLELAASAAPWEDEDLFWSYLPRCLLRGLFKAAATLLSSLTQHPLPFVSRAANLISSLLYEVPRSTAYNLASAHDNFIRHTHLFRNKVSDVIQTLEDEFDDAARWKPDTDEDERLLWYARFLPLLRLLAGDEHSVLEQAEDWKEALCAWSVLVRPAMIRDDIPPTMQKIVDVIALESTAPAEEALEALMFGHTAKAIQKCDQVSIWLATHLSDLLDKMRALQNDPMQESTFRESFIMRYADQLRADPGLWRLVCHYLSFVGPKGEARMRSLLGTIAYADPLEPSKSNKTNGLIPEEGSDEVTADEVLKACYTYGLDDVAAKICCDVADRLLTAREYGRATAYVVQAEDGLRMARITELLLDEYIQHGVSEFVRLVDALPTKLLKPGALGIEPEADDEMDADATFDQDGDQRQLALPAPINDNEPLLTGIFASSINFLAQYRDFHAFLAKGQRFESAKMLVGLLISGSPPRRFWAVLLFDALPLLSDKTLYFDSQDSYELLRCLEEVTGPESDAHGYLRALATISSPTKQRNGQTQPPTSQALDQLKLVRLALARNLARCFSAGI